MGGGARGVLTADEGDEPVVRVALGVGFDERGAGGGRPDPELLLGVGLVGTDVRAERAQQRASYGGRLGSGRSLGNGSGRGFLRGG